MMANSLLILIKLISPKKEENGFTLIELILVLMIFGILCAIAVPQFSSVTNKAKQKEASVIVSSIIKSAKAHQAEWGSVPINMGEISQYAKFQKCMTNNVETQGGSVCKNEVPVSVLSTDLQFYTSSGNYKIEILTSDNPIVFKIKANPNGTSFSSTGSAVVGCYKPETGTSHIKEYSSKEKGEMPFINCDIDSQTINSNNASNARNANIEETFEVVTPAVLQSSCGMSRYGQMWGAIDRRQGPERATDGNPDTKWSCRGNVEMQFDLGEEKTIGSVNIVLDDGGFVEIYVDNNLVKDQYIENDPNNRNLFTKIDLENIKGRYIEYRSITSYPNHRHTALGEFTVDVK